MSMNRRMLLTWGWIGAYVAALILAAAVQFGFEQIVPLEAKTSALVFGAVLLLAHVAVAIPAWRSLRGGDYRVAGLRGVPAAATVLESSWTGWRQRGGGVGPSVTMGGISHKRAVSREFKVRALVQPPGAAPYEATFFAFLPADQALTEGQSLPVKIHPSKPRIVVLAAGPAG